MQWHNRQPIYLQLKELIARQILEQQISEGELIPSIRQVSIDYQLNPLTVSKAYQALVDDGILIKQRGIGMQVVDGAVRKLAKQQKQIFLKHEWPQIKDKLKLLNIDIRELLDESSN